ncbi:hypothetical protein CCUS01_10269 [Colletotrichum cuscutae]|uniref:Uncharacterized protein n=1 Tax=Colletotrichum cuscutae TaxID=1209917 RepID=A0AAI9UCZ8_9PEZI|nr:hypothetical protein CCUS01_10269 [Colletotrichum cuscutae]
MEDHVTHFLLDLKDIDFTLSVAPAQLWQAGGGQHVKISVIETHGSELAGSDLGISCEASHPVGCPADAYTNTVSLVSSMPSWVINPSRASGLPDTSGLVKARERESSDKATNTVSVEDLLGPLGESPSYDAHTQSVGVRVWSVSGINRSQTSPIRHVVVLEVEYINRICPEHVLKTASSGMGVSGALSECQPGALNIDHRQIRRNEDSRGITEDAGTID